MLFCDFVCLIQSPDIDALHKNYGSYHYYIDSINALQTNIYTLCRNINHQGEKAKIGGLENRNWQRIGESVTNGNLTYIIKKGIERTEVTTFATFVC